MKRSLDLERPLAIVTLRTTGSPSESDRIVEIAIVKLFPTGRRTEYHTKINPGIPPPAGSEDERCSCDTGEAPRFSKIAATLYEMLKDCDIAGFGLTAGSLASLRNEFKRSGIEFSLDYRAVVDVMRIFHWKESRDLKAACRFYLNVELECEHSILEDARMTLRVLDAQLKRYQDLPCDPRSLCELGLPHCDRYIDSGRKFEWKSRQAAFAFGLHCGELLSDIAREDPDYLGWMSEIDLPPDTRQIAREALKGKFPRCPMTGDDV